MPFIDLAQRAGTEAMPGIVLRTFWGDNMLLSHVTLAPNSVVPEHSHPHEQGGIVVSGQMELTIAGETRTLHVGDMYIAPGIRVHSVVAGPEGCIALDIFSPVREEYKFAEHPSRTRTILTLHFRHGEQGVNISRACIDGSGGRFSPFIRNIRHQTPRHSPFFSPFRLKT